MKILIAGGGWSGVAAAVQAVKMGAETLLVERTDMLLGTGLVGGIMRNNGRFTATEELIAMGAAEIFTATSTSPAMTTPACTTWPPWSPSSVGCSWKPGWTCGSRPASPT
jgi:heterodisulfide reductase subunit A-like polyferredoxin